MARRRANGKKKSEARGARPKSHRRVKSLMKYLAAYGRGSDANVMREKFAKRCGTTLAYVVQLGYGYRLASESMAVEIERNTHRLVTVEELRPDIDWAYLAKRSAPINAAVR